jgi:hypothetical protein
MFQQMLEVTGRLMEIEHKCVVSKHQLTPVRLNSGTRIAKRTSVTQGQGLGFSVLPRHDRRRFALRPKTCVFYGPDSEHPESLAPILPEGAVPYPLSVVTPTTSNEPSERYG